jgi:O-antigen/teichoic acid export membrane protein
MHLQSLTGTMSATLATVFTYHTTRNDMPAAQHLYMQASRLLGAIAMIGCSGIFVFGHSFLRLWMGESYVTGMWWSRSDVVLMFMTGASLIGSMGLVSYQYLLATRKLKFLTWVRIAEAAANLGGSIAAAYWLGIAGIALSRVVVASIGGIVLMQYTLILLGVPGRMYAKRIGFPLTFVGAATATAGATMLVVLPPRAWATLFADSIVAGTAGAIALWFFALDMAQREDYLRKARRLLGRGSA